MKRSAAYHRDRELGRLIRAPLAKQINVGELALELWETLDTPVSLSCALLWRHGELKQLAEKGFNPSWYLDWESDRAANDFQAIAFLKKYPGEIPGVNPEEAAWTKFLACEEQCRLTNARFRSMRLGGRVSPFVHSVLYGAQRKIASWLGNLDAKSWALRCRFGPGADDCTKGPRVNAYHKLSALSSTRDFAEGAASLALDCPQWRRYLRAEKPEEAVDDYNHLTVSLSPCNKVVFVPKNALTHRSIAIEPRMNIYAQLGIGSLIRSRLKRVGLDLDNQEPSQVLAYLGSIDGTIATIDLSSASDTLAIEVVRELVPEPWFNAMDWCRSKTGHHEPKNVKFWYQKFSSMGNGFTFELESMIFYALALSCAEHRSTDDRSIRVYGDDIALPSSLVEDMKEILAFCGFTINAEKSFTTGVFRESCGADFFNGRNIRPYFQKELLQYGESLFRLANGIRRVAYRRNRGYGCDGQLRGFWVHVLRRIPKSLRLLKGPGRPKLLERDAWVDMETSSEYLISNWDEAQASHYVRPARHGWQGWLFASLQLRGARENVGESFDLLLLWALYTARDEKREEESDFKRPAYLGSTQVDLRGSSPPTLNKKAHALSLIHI